MVERFEPRAHPDNSLVKEARDQLYMAANILLLYGPKTPETTNVGKTGPNRKWGRFVWSLSNGRWLYRPVARTNVKGLSEMSVGKGWYGPSHDVISHT